MVKVDYINMRMRTKGYFCSTLRLLHSKTKVYWLRERQMTTIIKILLYYVQTDVTTLQFRPQAHNFCADIRVRAI